MYVNRVSIRASGKTRKRNRHACASPPELYPSIYISHLVTKTKMMDSKKADAELPNRKENATPKDSWKPQGVFQVPKPPSQRRARRRPMSQCTTGRSREREREKQAGSHPASQAGRQRDGETGKQRERDTHRQAEKDRERQTE